MSSTLAVVAENVFYIFSSMSNGILPFGVRQILWCPGCRGQGLLYPLCILLNTHLLLHVFPIKGVRRVKSAPQWPTLARSYSRHTEYGKDLASLRPLLWVFQPGLFPIYQSPIFRRIAASAVGAAMVDSVNLSGVMLRLCISYHQCCMLTRSWLCFKRDNRALKQPASRLTASG